MLEQNTEAAPTALCRMLTQPEQPIGTSKRDCREQLIWDVVIGNKLVLPVQPMAVIEL